jgi:hypothetical protein
MENENEFANYISSAAGCGGSGAGYTIPPPQNVILPPVNVSQSCYAPPINNSYLNAIAASINAPPTNIIPYGPPSPPASSSSSSVPINPYDRYRNIKFSNNYNTNNYGA